MPILCGELCVRAAPEARIFNQNIFRKKQNQVQTPIPSFLSFSEPSRGLAKKKVRSDTFLQKTIASGTARRAFFKGGIPVLDLSHDFTRFELETHKHFKSHASVDPTLYRDILRDWKRFCGTPNSVSGVRRVPVIATFN